MSDEMVERGARALCRAAGFDPDLNVHLGAPLFVAGRQVFPASQAVALWTIFETDARIVIEAVQP